MILMTPLKIKKIQPNNWDEWWNIWNNHSQIVKKEHKNHNNTEGMWRGLDLYTRLEIKTIYSAPHAPKAPVIDDIILQIEEQIPIELLKVRVIENLDTVSYHSDHDHTKHELRCFLWNTYDVSVWSFSYEGNIKQLVLPEDTNTWYYKDYPLKHSSIYQLGKSKGVMAIYGIPKLNFKNFIYSSAENYKNFAWTI